MFQRIDDVPLKKNNNVAEPSMKLEITSLNPSTTVVRIAEDNLDVGNDKDFRIQLKPILEANQMVLIDMQALKFIDSTGLASLLHCMRTMASKHGTLRLFGMSETIQALFELVRMNRIFEMYPSQEAALEDLTQTDT